jgi:hypothetical protein
MQKPNAAPDYERSAPERLLLKPGWRFKGLQLFSTAPWKAWVFFLLVLIIGGPVFAYFLVNDVDLTPGEWSDSERSSLVSICNMGRAIDNEAGSGLRTLEDCYVTTDDMAEQGCTFDQAEAIWLAQVDPDYPKYLEEHGGSAEVYGACLAGYE